MAEAAGKWDVRVFCRDENRDLADLWLKEGKYRSIPVIAFLDEKMDEIACYVEKPAAVYTEDQHAVEAFIKQYSDLPDAQLPTSQMSEQTYELYANFIRQFMADKPIVDDPNSPGNARAYEIHRGIFAPKVRYDTDF